MDKALGLGQFFIMALHDMFGGGIIYSYKFCSRSHRVGLRKVYELLLDLDGYVRVPPVLAVMVGNNVGLNRLTLIFPLFHTFNFLFYIYLEFDVE